MTLQTIESCFASTDPTIRGILEGCLQGEPLSWQDGVRLSQTQGADLHALCRVADHLRHHQVGDQVSYVVNRNINFTNVCIRSCRFCAFSRTLTSGEGYLLPQDEILRRCVEARDWGATEVCLQAGLAPGIDGMMYVDLCRTIHQALPELHIHAFSPEEIKYGSAQSGLSLEDFLQALKEAGLGSLPGTSAEILDDSIRDRISPGRISTAEWIDVIQTAHKLGIPTTSTLMFGHVETVADQMRHMDLLRTLQQETGGFTEFVPLSFVHQEAPLFLRSLSAGTRPGPTGNEVIRLYAISRLMLGSSIRNIQASWVKEGLRQAQWLLSCGVNDLGGTLINESISTSAGASHGQLMRPSLLRHAIRDAGRIPVQRSTLYDPLRVFSDEPEDLVEPLDQIDDPDAVFGSYDRLTQDSRFRYSRRRESAARSSGE